MGRKRKSSTTRKQRFEQFEKRLLMAADGVGFQPVDVEALVSEIAPLVSGTTTDLSTQSDSSANNYGFDGSGQTIAVIDSGIAYDHALFGGGGFGGSNTVVGGYDFAENDADPYDDGPAGYHGTHVAGIAAGDEGVASGADIVSLRVFDDFGGGKIEYIEAALQYVIENLDSFRNPITTVNLSLGADANETASDFAVLDDELAQLKADGVFISVAAGNDFEDLQTKGLSHPADSEYVVAVASNDSNNQLSDFSQRADGVLVAPGEDISSAVPNALFGNRKVNQTLRASGTSQAAPYVAGASAVLREAYGALGYGEVDQDTLYQTFLETSNAIFDSVTNTTYRQLDLNAAIESITQAANRSVTENVTRIGTLDGGEILRGTIDGASDTERYQFTAAADGQVELTFEATQQLDPTLQVVDAAGEQVELQFDGERVYINVIGAESYQLEVGSQSGAGQYQISTVFQQAIVATDLGRVDSIQVTDMIAGEQTYSLTASHSGPATFGFATDAIDGTIEVFDANMNRLTSQTVEDGRVDFQFDVTAGEQLFVSLQANGNVELSVENLVSIQDGTVTVYGTEAADSFIINDGATLDVNVNGNLYSIDSGNISSVVIHGDASEDSLQLTLGDRFERTVLRQNRVDAFDGNKTFRAIGFNEIDVQGNGSLTVAGSEQNDSIFADFETASISSSLGIASGHGFDTVIADGKGGDDSVTFVGSNADEILFSRDNYSAIRNDSARLIAINYEQLSVDGGGGYDITNLFGTGSDDLFSLGDEMQITDGSVDLNLSGFERATAFSGGGNDAILFTDSEGNDRFLFADGTSQLVTQNTHIVAHDFNDLSVNATGGDDVAQINGSKAGDAFHAGSDQSILISGSATVEINGFDRINVVSNIDAANSVAIIGTNGDDQLVVDSFSATTVFASGSIVRAVGFSNVSFDGLGGSDVGVLNGSDYDDILVSNQSETTFRGQQSLSSLLDVELIRFDGDAGRDTVYVDDALALDLVASIGERAVAVLERHQIEAENIELIDATAVDGVIGTYDMERVDLESVLRGRWQRS